MMHRDAKNLLAATLLTLAFTSPAAAKLAPDQLARLGTDLTPMGAERAGNADATIPAWTGGIKSAANAGFPDFKTGGNPSDPFSCEKGPPKITKTNKAP